MRDAAHSPSERRSAPPGDDSGDRARKTPAQEAATLSPEELKALRRRDGAARLMTVDPKSYQITGEVAQGGIGRIFRAHSVCLDRPVAIKELLTSAGPVAEERFVREARFTARLQHPSIIPLYEAGRWPSGAPFYAMKYVSGRSLADVIFECRSLAQRLGLLPHVLAVAEAMAYAHSERIIHRDLKPANILVGAFGETVVIDWGLAKDLTEEEQHLSTPPGEGEGSPAFPGGDAGEPGAETTPRPPIEALTMHGAVMGTPAYMPLEQATGKQVDERADVYALGAILYHLLAGTCPYDGDSSVGILRKVVARAPEPLEQRQKGIPEDLLTIVKKAMAREPADRYPSAQELAEDLRRFQTGQIVGAHKYSRAERIRRLIRRYRAALSVGLAALVLLSITVGLGFHHNLTQRYRAEAGEAAAHRAEQRAVARADDLTLVHARAAALRDPNEALAWLKSLSPSFSRWPEARLIAADAEARGIATVLRGHTAIINQISFSPDGKQIATTSDDHTVRLWDTTTKQSRVLLGHTDEVWRTCFSPSGDLLASAGKDRTIRIWDARSGELRQVLTGNAGEIYSLKFVREDQVVSGSTDTTVRLWDIRTEQDRVVGRGVSRDGTALSPDRRQLAFSGERELRIYDLESDRLRSLGGNEVKIVASIFSPDSRRVISRDEQGALRQWDLSTGKSAQLPHLSLNGGPPAFGILTVGFRVSPDGKLLAAAGHGTDVHLWNLATGLDRSLEGHQGLTSTVSFSPDGKRIASGSYDHTVRLWDLASGDSQVFHGFDDFVNDVAFSPDGKLLAAASADGALRLLSVTPSSDRVLTDHAAGLLHTAFSPDGRLLAAGGRDGKLHLWDRRGGASTLFEGHRGPVRNLVFSPNGELLASSGEDQVTHIWDLSGHPIWSMESFAFKDQAPLAFSPDGQLFAVTGVDGAVNLLNLDSGVARTLLRNTRPVIAVAFSPDSKRLAAGNIDGKVHILDLASGESRTIGAHEQEVIALAFSSSGAILASGSQDHTVGFWNVATGEGRRISASGGGVLQVAFTAGDQVAVTRSTGETKVRLWDMATFTERKPLGGHTGVLTSFALSPEGGRLVTASHDGTARLWNLESGESRVLTGHTDGIMSVAFSPDGRLFASASLDKTVRLWSDELPEDGASLRAWIEAAAPETIDLYHQSPGAAPAEMPVR